MKKSLMILSAAAALTGCAELQHKDGRFTASGASFNVLFLQIPRPPMESAKSKVPADATVTNVNSSPQDWRYLPGFLSRLLGAGWTQIGGTTK